MYICIYIERGNLVVFCIHMYTHIHIHIHIYSIYHMYTHRHIHTHIFVQMKRSSFSMADGLTLIRLHSMTHEV